MGTVQAVAVVRPCIPRLTQSLRRHLTKTVEPLTVKEHLGVTLGQQGAET
jgi:hypothetical protein